MNQDILTLTIVIAAACYMLYLFIRQSIALFRKRDNNLSCAGCAGCTLHLVKNLKTPETHHVTE